MTSGVKDRREVLAKYCQMPIEKVSLISAPIHVLPDGLVFLMAYWSGPALESFWQVTGAINQQPESYPVLHVLDIDECEGLLRSQLPGNSVVTGVGELLMVRNSKTIGIAYPLQSSPEELRNFVNRNQADQH